MSKQDIDLKYQRQHADLQEEFFDIVDEGTRRELKPDKVLDDFNEQHGDLWTRHKAELIAKGFASPDPAVKPSDIEILAGRIAALEAANEMAG